MRSRPFSRGNPGGRCLSGWVRAFRGGDRCRLGVLHWGLKGLGVRVLGPCRGRRQGLRLGYGLEVGAGIMDR